MKIKGIDVSKHNGSINWEKVKSDGVEFAILRIGYGGSAPVKDETFEENYKNARANGIKVGVYIYSYADSVSDVIKEYEAVINWLGGRHLDLPVYYDVEDKKMSVLSRNKLSDYVKTFCEAIENEGYWVGIYANKSWLENKLDMNMLKNYTVWLAQWTNEPTYKGSYAMWQYTSDGSVKGISGRVDMNYLLDENLIGAESSETGAENSQTEPNYTGKITYQSYDNKKKKWLPEVNSHDTDEYAGNLGNNMGGLRAKPTYGEIKIQAHVIGKGWLGWISSKNYSKNNKTNGNTYSGLYGQKIDMVIIRSTKGNVDYRVYDNVKNKWLPWVNSNNQNEYAGNKGNPISGIQMK